MTRDMTFPKSTGPRVPQLYLTLWIYKQSLTSRNSPREVQGTVGSGFQLCYSLGPAETTP